VIRRVHGAGITNVLWEISNDGRTSHPRRVRRCAPELRGDEVEQFPRRTHDAHQCAGGQHLREHRGLSPLGRVVTVRTARPRNGKDVCRAPAGKGAIYEWSGNGKAGEGRLEIIADGVFMNLDRMIGKDFESGLANLTSIAER
jgi:hypothetical protein